MQKERTAAEIKSALAEVGIGLTTQRLAIASCVLSEADHPTANEVYDLVSKKLSVVSKATVYNTLGLFVKSGLLTEVCGGAHDSVRYDGNTKPHHHLRDPATGRLTDIPYHEIEFANLSALKKRYKASRITVIIDGEPAVG
jgi:Fur family transcriptional regulator, iron response regulator